MHKTSDSDSLGKGALTMVQAGRGVVRCFIDPVELRRICARMAAAELAGAVVRAALLWPGRG